MAPIVSLLDTLRESHAGNVRVSDGAARALTGMDLVSRAAALAEDLERSDISTLALYLDNGPEWIVADLACQAAGVCLVPLPTFFSSGQIRHVLDTIPIDAICCSKPEDLTPLCNAGLKEGGNLALDGSRTLFPEPTGVTRSLPTTTGKVTFTSGSTGRPKGVCLSHDQLLMQAQALATAVGLERPRHLCVLPLSTLLENIAGVFTPLLAGGEVIVPPLDEIGFTGSSELDTQRFLAIITRQQPTSLILTPQLLQVLVGAARGGWEPPGSLAFVAVGGARVPAGLVESAHKLGIPAYEGYGLSECASVVSLNQPGATRPGSCGRPLPHLALDVVNGEVRVSGNAMLGYAGEPASWGRSSIATGDLGHLDADGFLYIEGRRKNLLISSYGRNISPEWVESELIADGSLADCVVFGDDRPFCVALLHPHAAGQSDAAIEQNIDTCNRTLPDYARVRAWRRLPEPLAATGELLTANGRPKRAAIQSRYASLIESLYHDPMP